MRISRFTISPTWAIARRISRFLPSRMPTVSQALAPFWLSSLTSIGANSSPSITAPRRSGAKVRSLGLPFTRTR